MLVERYISIGDVDGSIIMILLALRKDAIVNYTKYKAVNEVLDEKTGELGTIEINEYIHVSGINDSSTGARYHDPEVTFEEGKTYMLSFWMRTQPQLNINANKTKYGDGFMTVRVFAEGILNQNGGIHKEISNTAYFLKHSGAIYTGNDLYRGCNLSEQWQKYTIVFKADLSAELNLRFQRHYCAGEDVVPFDIDGLSLVEVKDGSYTPIDGTELIKDDKALWSGFGPEKYEATVSHETDCVYYRSEGGLGLNIQNTEVDTEILEPGIYTLTASVRLTNFDHARVTVAAAGDAHIVAGNLNTAIIQAIFDGDYKIPTFEGKRTKTVTSSWTPLEFVFEADKSFKISDIKFVLNERISADFKNIKLTAGGTMPENIEEEIPEDPNKPKPLPAITEGNLIDGAIDSDKLPYWTRGEQTITVKRDSGTKYFSVSNLTSNTLGFTYEPGYMINPGFYYFTGEFRTANKVESTMLQVELGERFTTAIIDNNWKTVSFSAEITAQGLLKLKIRNGVVANNVKDYEFKNIALYSMADIPADFPLYVGGDFDDFTKTPLNDVRMYYGTGTFKWVKDGDNGYINVSNRSATYTPIVVDTTAMISAGSTYKITYDVRTSDPGEVSTMRAFIGPSNTKLAVDNPVPNDTQLYEITNEWRRVEHIFTATRTEDLDFLLSTGPYADHNDSFDFDNFSVTRVEDVEVSDEPKMYEETDVSTFTAGTFDDEEATHACARLGYLGGPIVWLEEGDNGFVRVTGRAKQYVPVEIDTGCLAEPGKTYKVSYDIRIADAGYKMHARGYIQDKIGIKVPNYIEDEPVLFEITDEWKHIEGTFTVSEPMNLIIHIKGGYDGVRDLKDFDVDNVKVEIVG